VLSFSAAYIPPDDLFHFQDGHDPVTDLLLAMAANQQDSAALRHLLAMQHAGGLHPASTADASLAAAAGQQLALPGNTAADGSTGVITGVSTVLAAPLALSLGAAGELPLLQGNSHNPAGSGLQMAGSLHAGGEAVQHTGSSGSEEAAAAAAASMQALQGLQFVQMPDGQLQALQSQDFAALLQHQQQQQLAMLVGAGSAAAAAVPDGHDYTLDGQQHQQQQHMHEPAAKQARTEGGGHSEDEAAELAELHRVADHAAEAAVAAAAAAASAAAAGEAAAAAAGGMDAVSSSAAEDAALLAALQQLTGGTGGDLHLGHAGGSHAALGTVVNIGGVNMLIPAATQLQLAALAGAGGGDQHSQQDAQLLALQQQQLQLAQFPLLSGLGGGLQHTIQVSGGSLGGSISGSETDISQLQMQQQLAQIQQLQQIQFMQLQLAAQQQGMMLAPAAARSGLGGSEDGVAAHMVRRHGVLPERMVTRDMLRQVRCYDSVAGS
jgi:hypothetical protein